jgi:DNA-binding response OmpR family regulator
MTSGANAAADDQEPVSTGPATLSPVGTATILVVDDEAKIRELVRSYLEREGYAVLEADGGQRALETVARALPDLIVLDLMLPDLSGEEVARSIRSVSAVPIIMLTAKASEDDRVAGLRLGADDYLVKPFSPRELVARVEAVLRRAGEQHTGSAQSFGGGAVTMDRETRDVTVDGEPVELTRSEFDLLFALASRPGRVFSRFELVTRVQGYDYEGYDRTVDAHVKNLRKKLGDSGSPRLVITVTGVGYKFGLKADA